MTMTETMDKADLSQFIGNVRGFGRGIVRDMRFSEHATG
jgi:hypothetical protein